MSAGEEMVAMCVNDLATRTFCTYQVGREHWESEFALDGSVENV